MRALVCVVGLSLVSLPSPSMAQGAGDFSALRARVGDKVYVTDAATRVEVGGRITALTPAALSIDGYTFAPVEGLKIERPGDPVWDGAAIGFGVGALLGATVGAEACLHRAAWHCVAEVGVPYAVLGAVIDYAHKGRKTIYRAPAPRKTARLVPDVGAGRTGLAVALGF